MSLQNKPQGANRGRKNWESVSRKLNAADNSNKRETEKCPSHSATQRLLVTC